MLFLIPEEKPITFGERLAQCRTARRLTAKELACQSGLRNMCIIRIEQGVIDNPDLKMIRKLAGALDMSISQFFEGVE